MRVVAIRALHLAFAQRMMGSAQHLRPDILVALYAGFRLGFVRQTFWIVFMNAVAAGAGKIPALMFAAVPEGLSAPGMALQAGGIDFTGRVGAAGFQ